MNGIEQSFDLSDIGEPCSEAMVLCISSLYNKKIECASQGHPGHVVLSRQVAKGTAYCHCPTCGSNYNMSLNK
jgi:hypothetical protein